MSIIPRPARLLMAVFLFSASLTVLFLSQRAVLNIGGFCAEGGPYEIATHCPEGIPLMATVAPLVMIASIFLFAFSAKGHLAGVFFLWAGLFVSLGWNFLEFGLNPPEGDGRIYAWLITGVLFILMGLAPLIAVFQGFFLARSGSNNRLPRRSESQGYLIPLLAGCVLLGISVGVYLFK